MTQLAASLQVDKSFITQHFNQFRASHSGVPVHPRLTHLLLLRFKGL